jgi:hypothetical protein
MSLLDLFGRKPTAERLAREILAVAAAAGERGWRFEPSTKSLVKEDGATIHLVNIFLEYSQADKSRRRGLVEKYATMLSTARREIPKLWTLAQKSVYAVIRSRHDRAALEIANRGTGKSLPQRVDYDWHGDLVIRIVYDFGPSVAQVDTARADIWGISRAELLETAKRNLRALPKPEWNSPAPGVFKLVSSASYEESMLLRDDVWDGLAVAGEIVAIAPNRGVLLAADADDPNALEALLTEALACLQQKPWPLDPVIVRRRDGSWLPYEPTGRAATVWQLHCKVSLASAYAEQQESLRQHTSEDAFVATFTLMNRKDQPEQPVSYTVWTEGVPTSLPETDLLAFNKARNDGKFDTAFVKWADARRICGVRMTALPEQPPRWRVDSFPSSEEWQELLAVQSKP